MKREIKLNFDITEIEVLRKNAVSIINNERGYYFFSNERKEIPEYGSPTEFYFQGFRWQGIGWKKLMYELVNWFINKQFKTEEELLQLKLSYTQKVLFSREKKGICIGPFANGLFVNGNNSTSHMWWQIIEILNSFSRFKNKVAIIRIHFPSNIEPKSVVNLIWRKEINEFRNYLKKREYSENEIKKHIEHVQNLNGMYKKITDNYIFFIVDRRADFYNIISRIRKKYGGYEKFKEYEETIKEISTFKRDLTYADYNSDIKEVLANYLQLG